MAKRLHSWFVDRVATNLKLPQNNFFGRLIRHTYLRNNTFLTLNAVRLCNIQPDHNVLEVGFGTGFGLQAALPKIKDGTGTIYGIDTSPYMFDMARRRVHKGVEDGKVVLFQGSAVHIPLNTSSVHRVYHCNCFYYWPDLHVMIRELYRVMKPGGVMVTTLCLDRVKKAQVRGVLKYGPHDESAYRDVLQKCGFDVRMDYLTDEKKGLQYQAIFATIDKKPTSLIDKLHDFTDEEKSRTIPGPSLQSKKVKDHPRTIPPVKTTT